MGRKASEKDSGNNLVDGNADCGAGHGTLAERCAGNGAERDYELVCREITSQQQRSQAQQEHTPQDSETPRRETTPANAVKKSWPFFRFRDFACKKGSQAAPLFVVLC